jgi:hypothetical protein
VAQVAGENSVSTFNGWFKEVYADKVERLIPDGVSLLKDIKFVPKAKQQGNTYNQPVVLTHEHGFTYATYDQGSFAVNAAIAAVHKNATIQGVQLLLESRIDLETLARAKGPNSFGSATKHLMENMVKSFQRRKEVECLYGGTGSVYCGLAQIGARISGAGTATQVFSIKDGHWAPGLWTGTENARLEVFDNDGSGSVAGTQRYSSDTITVSSVDYANKRVTLVTTGANIDNVAADDFLYFHGAKANSADGLVTIASSTGSRFGIDGSTYGLWQGNTHAVGSLPLTFTETIRGHDSAVGRGLDEDVLMYVNPGAWTDLMTDQVALRRFDSSYSTRELKQGSRGVQFEAQFGRITIKPHTMIKEGIALSLSKKSLMRVGATDTTFNIPGFGDQHLYVLPTNAGVGVRAYSNEAIFSKKLAGHTLFTGIVNS